jgi:putative ABC transport system permease protein
LWQRRFGGDPGIVGKAIYLNGTGHHLVGVMPQGFQAIFRDHELWAPLQLTASERSDRTAHYLWAVGRLKPGVTLQQADADLDAIGGSLEREYPAANTGRGLRAASVQAELIGNSRSALMLLMGAVGLVLLVACVNVANLLLARALSRSKEIAIRRALGAGRGRLVSQFFTEGLLLAGLGTAAGLMLAQATLRLLPRIIPSASPLPGLDQVVIDGPVLQVVVITGVLVGMLLGCVPAWQLLHSAAGVLSERTVQGSGRGQRGLRNALLAMEVALSLVLLLGAALLLHSFTNLMRVPAGFRANRVLTAQLQMPSQGAIFFRQVRERVRAVPGVEDVAAIEYLPLSGSGVTRRMLVEGRPRPEPGGEPIVQRHIVSPDYFRSMGIPSRWGALSTMLICRRNTFG